jgi:hypothetical protein
MAAMKAQ